VLCVCLCSGAARAHDASDDVTLGRISSPSAKTSTPYWSDRLRGTVEPTDTLAFDLGASVTRYGATPGVAAMNIFQFTLGTSYTPNDHLAFDIDGFLSPESTSVVRGVQITNASKGAVRDRTSAMGFDFGAEYDTAGDTNAESAIGLSLGTTAYSSTQAVRLRKTPSATSATSGMFGAPEQASLLQSHADLSLTETLYADTDIGLLGTYYVYNRDTAQSGYYGTSVFGRSVDDGIPIAPLQYTVRPSLTHRFAGLQLRVYAQYGDYRSGDGSSFLAGFKAQYKFTRAVRAWLGGYIQRDTVSGSALDLMSVNLGLRIIF
jgi:hypothetical protein